MRFKTIFLALTFHVISGTNGHSLSKLHLSNASDIYKVQEDENTKTIQFTNPKSNIPTLREIIYYHIIEKPFFGSNEIDNEGPEFDDTARPFTNAHGMPDTIHQEDTDKNIVEKESSDKEDFVTSSEEKLDSIEDKSDETSEQLENVDVDENDEKVSDDVLGEENEPLIGVEVILNADQGLIDTNINTTEDTNVSENENSKINAQKTQDAEIDASEEKTGLTEMELILNENSEVETEVTQEPSIEETTEHLEIPGLNPSNVEDIEEPSDMSVEHDIEIDATKVTTPKSEKEQVKTNVTTKTEIGETTANTVDREQKVNYTRNTEILMTKRNRLFGSPEQLKERALKMKNIMHSIKLRQPEEKRRRKRETTDEIPEGPSLPELDYSTLPEYVRSLISTTEKTMPKTKSIENPNPIVESKDDTLSTDMQDRLINILNQIKPLLSKSDSKNEKESGKSENENNKAIDKSDNYEIENTFKGRTYGMNLNSGRGSVWNDIINDTGNHVHFGDSIPEGAQEHLNFYHDEAYSDEDDIRREIIKRIQEIFANTDTKENESVSTTEGIKEDRVVNTEMSKTIIDKSKPEKAEGNSDKIDEVNSKNIKEAETVKKTDDELNNSPDKHKEIVPQLKTDSHDEIFDDENSSSDNNYGKSDNDKENKEKAKSDTETPIEIPEGASDAEFIDKLRQGRTYGMNLTDEEGVVWNDLFTKPGVKINFGEQSTDEEPSEDKSEQLKPLDGETTSVDDDDDIYVKVEKKKPFKESHEASIKAKSELDAVNTEKDSTKDLKDIETQNDENEPEINTEPSFSQSDIDLDLVNDVIKAVIGLDSKKDQPTEAELDTNKDSDDKEKFWKWMTEWTTAYTQLLAGFLDRKISDAMSDFKTSLKPEAISTEILDNPEDIEIDAEKEAEETIEIIDDGVIPVNNTNLLRRRKDKDHNKKSDSEVSKVNSTENLPNVTATTIYGNAVGNNKVTNIFVFLTERNASLNFVQDIIKDGDKIVGNDINPGVEKEESKDISAIKEEPKPDVPLNSTEIDLTTESAKVEDIEENKEENVNLHNLTGPNSNEINNKTINHENITILENKNITGEIDKEVVTTGESEQDNSKSDNNKELLEPVKPDTATNTDELEPKTNQVVNESKINNTTLSEEKLDNTDLSEDNKHGQDEASANADESEAKANKVIDERITDNNNKTSDAKVDTQTKENSEEKATSIETVTKIDIENPNVNLTDVNLTDNENAEVTAEDTTTKDLVDIETTTNSFESTTLV